MAQLSLPALEAGDGPRAATLSAASEFTSGWTTAASAWLTQPATWRAAADSAVSWAVSFRVSLARAGVDPSQPFSVAQVFTGREGKQVPVAETVRGFKEILEGKHDDVAEGDFYMKGGIDEVRRG